MEQEKLNKIIASHGRWLQNDGGKRADLKEANLERANLNRSDLRGANLREANLREANLREANLCHAYLREADLREADLRGAYLREANLREADLCHADLRGANLRGANLREANLREADLREADLCHADLRGANLPVGAYQIVGPGSRNRCTTYNSSNDRVTCGCWDDKKGNHLDSFIARVERIYGSNGKNPNSVYYAEYMAAISFFKAVKELNKKS